MGENNDPLTSQTVRFLPKSNLLSEVQSKTLLARHGVENDRIVCFNDIIYNITYEDVPDIVPYDQYYTRETADYILDCVDVIRGELLRAMKYNNVTVLSEGYFSVDGFEDPMRDAFNTESGAMAPVYLRLSDMLCLAYKTLRNPKTQKQFQKEIYETIFMLSVDTEDRTDWYESGRLKPVVRAKKLTFALSKNWAQIRARKLAKEKAGDTIKGNVEPNSRGSANGEIIPEQLETVADTTVVTSDVFAKRLAERKSKKDKPTL